MTRSQTDADRMPIFSSAHPWPRSRRRSAEVMKPHGLAEFAENPRASDVVEATARQRPSSGGSPQPVVVAASK